MPRRTPAVPRASALVARTPAEDWSCVTTIAPPARTTHTCMRGFAKKHGETRMPTCKAKVCNRLLRRKWKFDRNIGIKETDHRPIRSGGGFGTLQHGIARVPRFPVCRNPRRSSFGWSRNPNFPGDLGRENRPSPRACPGRPEVFLMAAGRKFEQLTPMSP